jgi:hypothetical protein
MTPRRGEAKNVSIFYVTGAREVLMDTNIRSCAVAALEMTGTRPELSLLIDTEIELIFLH